MLARMRSLSETSRCHFVLAGFWELFQAVELDYQSPVNNFGEPLYVDALEAEACRELATLPMATMNLKWESDALVETLVTAVGRRANLISIVCNEILKDLGPEDRTIRAAILDRALASDAVEGALSDWKYLTGGVDLEGERLDRILVYATIRRPPFTLGEVVEIVRDLGEEVPPDRVERSLKRLVLAFVLGREVGRFEYRVPLFQRMVQEQDPEILLKAELASVRGPDYA